MCKISVRQSLEPPGTELRFRSVPAGFQLGQILEPGSVRTDFRFCSLDLYPVRIGVLQRTDSS